MNDIDRKALRREYKETALPAGIFGVRNTVSGRLFIGASPNLPGMLNRQRFQLEMGSHPDRELQSDWNDVGSSAFEFEVIDRLDPDDEGTRDQTTELAELKTLWVERLTEAGTSLYPSSRRGI